MLDLDSLAGATLIPINPPVSFAAWLAREYPDLWAFYSEAQTVACAALLGYYQAPYILSRQERALAAGRQADAIWRELASLLPAYNLAYPPSFRVVRRA